MAKEPWTACSVAAASLASNASHRKCDVPFLLSGGDLGNRAQDRRADLIHCLLSQVRMIGKAEEWRARSSDTGKVVPSCWAWYAGW